MEQLITLALIIVTVQCTATTTELLSTSKPYTIGSSLKTNTATSTIPTPISETTLARALVSAAILTTTTLPKTNSQIISTEPSNTVTTNTYSKEVVTQPVTSTTTTTTTTTAKTTTTTTTTTTVVPQTVGTSFSTTGKTHFISSINNETFDDKKSSVAIWPASLSPPAHVPTLLEERLDTLACDISLPPNAKIWRANQTEELILPIKGEPLTGDDAWSGSAIVQTGDVLLVKVDDSALVLAAKQHNGNADIEPSHPPPLPLLMEEEFSDSGGGSHRRRQPDFSVYQVTRLGYEKCDATEGVLLDITPLEIDNRQVVTLYDKDLTEGINLLIVVSTRWLSDKCVRLRVVVKADNCGDGQDCSAKGVCFTNVSMEGFECQCCAGFVGAHCEEQDACYPSPCRNHGICVDISQGHDGSTYQCLCPYGYTGKTCEKKADPCDSFPCKNGGTCYGNTTNFRCECPVGFSGPECLHNKDECASAPCVHGICVNQEDGYRCFCQPGFSGEHCEYEYNECESSPCINGGICTDQIGGYKCSCGPGYSGKRCHLKVDLCEPNPCQVHLYCVDRGNNYTCECPKGYTGPKCHITARTVCSDNPCHNGGTCWNSADTFYCACRPGFTGKICEDRFILEIIPTPHSHSAADGPLDEQAGIDLQVPISIHLEHLHSIYIAAGTLACALLIVIFIVTVCHCKVHETYKRCFIKPSALLPFRIRHLKEEEKENGSHATSPLQPVKNQEKTRNIPNRSFPTLGTSDMYYTLDFSDSQSSPLIQ